jgi:integrase
MEMPACIVTEGPPFWYVAYSLSDGRRVLRSTRQVIKRKALEVAHALEKVSRTARAGELTESKTRAWFNEMLTGAGLAAARHDSVRGFALQWLASKRLSVKCPIGNSLRTRPYALLLDSLGPRVDKPISSVTPADIVAYRDERMRDAIAGGTLHHYLKIIRAVFTSARRQGLILSNPAEAVDLPRIKRNERAVFAVQEVKALLAVALAEWQTLILLAFYTGARLRDCSRLDWSAVDLAEGFITFRQGKTRKKVVLPIHPALSEHLLAIAGDQCGPLCPLLSAQAVGARALSDLLDPVVLRTMPPRVAAFMLYEPREPPPWRRQETLSEGDHREQLEDCGSWVGQ